MGDKLWKSPWVPCRRNRYEGIPTPSRFRSKSEKRKLTLIPNVPNIPNMDKPVCRLCGGRHWSTEPHAFENAKTSGGRAKEKPVDSPAPPKVVRSDRGRSSCQDRVPESEASQPVTSTEATSSAARTKEWRKKNPEKYREYMRRYMRERRKG